jgi:type I restriction enzyme S subunit
MSNTEQPQLPDGWRWVKLNKLGKLIGGGTPSRKTEAYFQGDIPWATIKDLQEDIFELTDTQEHITPEAVEKSATNLIESGSVIIATRVGLGKIAINRVAIAINQDLKALGANRTVLPEYILYALRKQTFDILKYGQGSTVKGILQSDLLNIDIPLPPIAVQERVVVILQKADDIRRKRQEALKIAEAVLPALFYEMFGDPLAGTNNFDLIPLGEIAEVRSGVTKGRKLDGKDTIEAPYLRVANVQDGFLDLSEIKTIEVLEEDLEKYALQEGDVLMTEGGDPDKLGRGTVWRNEIEGCIYQNHIFRVRTDREKLLPEFLAALLRMQYAKSYFLGCAKRSSNLASINSKQVKQFPIPLPPLELQRKFLEKAEQFTAGAGSKLNSGLEQATNTFSALLHKAFTGELTAAWETSHAEEIAASQCLHEQMPALLLLAFIQAKAEQTAKFDAMLITALMKYTFLAQMEGETSRRLFHFVPYHYGPFSKDVYDGLEVLQQRGLITVEQAPEEGKTRIALTEPVEAAAVLADLPESLKRDVEAIISQYGELEHKELLQAVYGKYPAYARKSRLVKKIKPVSTSMEVSQQEGV